ncbi:MAG: hypothetical protein WEB59_00925 [Thermoanaerobaculia bacterium]
MNAPRPRRRRADPAAVSRLARAAGVSALLARLLLRRGVETAGGARAYLDPCRGVLHDPSLLAGLAATRAPMDLLVRLEPGRKGWGNRVEILAARPPGSLP